MELLNCCLINIRTIPLIEFLKLDDHLKENLRKEKEKRINEVLSQMKFILDTDDLKDSYGKWSCCESEDYSAEGCT